MIGGKEGIALESKSDDQIISESMDVLRRIFGDQIPNPKQFLVTV